MTEQNGVWLSSSFVSLRLLNDNKQDEINWEKSLVNQNSYNSHLEQLFKNELLEVKQ